MVPGLELATQLVLDLCGGEPSAIAVAGDPTDAGRVIDFPLAEVKRLAGLDVSPADIKQILGDLGFGLAGTGASLAVTVPSWRPDVEGKADLVEEVVRIVGVDRIPSLRSTAATPRASPCSPRSSGAPARPSARSQRAAWSRR